MNVICTVEPVLEPITVDEQQAWSRITDEGEGATIEGLITTARIMVEQYTRRALMTKTMAARFDCFPSWFELEFPPLQSITSVEYIDTAGATQSVSSANYFADLYSTPCRIFPIPSYTWPSTQDGRPNVVIVTYVAGYTSASLVPSPIRTAISMLVDHLYEHRGPVLIGQTLAEIPFSVTHLLGPWRVF